MKFTCNKNKLKPSEVTVWITEKNNCEHIIFDNRLISTNTVRSLTTTLITPLDASLI